MPTDELDELARTATAPAQADPDAATSRTSQPGIGTTLGRYRLERELGAGGMGVVYAAFDPDLERRIALKVLRTADHPENRKRLLREARAMARLRHPNVVVVYEVGSVDGRDYVAMELVEGGSLADWLRPRVTDPGGPASGPERSGAHGIAEILDVFAAAGRGLAAAHAAGIVHRDFKPHNVLRGKDGRILVTDFGLARDASTALETTLPTSTSRRDAPMPLPGLTATGSVLGTPAYMAPEQWSGGRVGPPADQFAFSVALWEALTGERPYRGTTSEQLKELVTRGPARLDGARLPRHVRGPLRRGLDPDPDKRWPSIDALVAALERRKRFSIALVASLAALVIAGVAAVLMMSARHDAATPPVSACASPRVPGIVWTADARGAMQRAGRTALVPLFDGDAASWYAVRDATCTGGDAATPTCLDGVLSRLDLAARAIATLPGDASVDEVSEQLVDPHACEATPAPKLAMRATRDTVEATAAAIWLARDPASSAAETVERLSQAGVEPCARAVALRALHAATSDRAKRDRLARSAFAAADTCDDDRLRADVLLDQLGDVPSTDAVGEAERAAYERAKPAVARVAQPDVVARLLIARARIERGGGRWDDAFATLDEAATELGKRPHPHFQLHLRALAAAFHLSRGDRVDIEAVREIYTRYHSVAAAGHFDDVEAALAHDNALAFLYLDDVSDAKVALEGLYHYDPWQDGLQTIQGRVVDRAGKPVANATVWTAARLRVTRAGVVPLEGDSLVSATTDATGAYEIKGAPQAGAVIAERVDKTGALIERSAPVMLQRELELVLAPLRRIDGKLDGPVKATTLVVATASATRDLYEVLAPVSLDGTFSLQGLPAVGVEVGTLAAGARAPQHITYAAPTTVRVTLATSTADRELDVTVHRASADDPDHLTVVVLPGRHDLAEVATLAPMRAAGVREAIATAPLVPQSMTLSLSTNVGVSVTSATDRLAHFDGVLGGDVTVCVVPVIADLGDARLDEVVARLARAGTLGCTQVAAGESKAAVSVSGNL